MGLFDNSHDKGKEDGTKGEKDNFRYNLDKDYRNGYDHGQGLKDGSRQAKDHDNHPISGPLSDALWNREGFEKLGKSDSYKNSYNRGRDTYGKNTISDKHILTERRWVEKLNQKGEASTRDYSGLESGYETQNDSEDRERQSNDKGLSYWGILGVLTVILVFIGFVGTQALHKASWWPPLMWGIIGSMWVVGIIFAIIKKLVKMSQH
jgi:hypothetical protein